MKKIKLLLAAMAAMVSLGLNAATDITDQCLKNADLSTDPATANNGWTLRNGWRQDYQKATDDQHVNVVEFYAGWGSLQHTEYAMTQTISLPAGYYRLAVNAFYRNGNAGDGTNPNKAWIFAGDKKQNVYGLENGGIGGYSGSNDLWKASNAFYQGKFSNEFDFHLTEEQDINIGFEGIFSEAYCWVILGPVKIYEYTAADYQADLDAKADAAITAINALSFSDALKTSYVAQVNAKKNGSYTTVDEVTAAINDVTTIQNEATVLASTLSPLYASYNSVAANATFVGVDAALISAQNEAVENATDAAAIESAIATLQAAIDAVPTFNITSYTIQNPGAQSKDGWEGTDFGGQSNGVTEYWNVSPAGFYQTISLPAGNYRLTVVALQRTNMTGTVYAGETSTFIVQVPATTVNDRSQAASWFNSGKGRNYVNFTVAEAGDVVIGLKADETTGDHWTVWQSFQLDTYDETVAASYLKPGYEEAMAAAVAYQTADMFDADKTALNNAINDNTVDEGSATIDAYEAAVENLNAAVAAAKAAVANYTAYNNIVSAIGENTNVDLSSFVINGDFELGDLSGWTSVDGGAQATNRNFGRMSGDHFVERWRNGAALVSGSLTHDAIYLPAGLYRITADAQNIEQYNNNVGGTGLFLCANDEKTEIGASANYQVFIKLADKEALTIKFLLDNCTGNWISYDKVTLTYVGSDYPDLTLVEGKMNADVAAAQTAASEAYEANRTGATLNALSQAIAAAQASKDAYAIAKVYFDEIAETNVYTASAFATYYTEPLAKYEEDQLTTEEANALMSNGWHAANNIDDILLSAWTIGGEQAVNYDKALYINTWSTEGDYDGTNFKAPFFEYFADGVSLGENTLTATVTGLANGQYKVSAWVRVRVLNDEITEATGITMDVNGDNSVDVAAGSRVGTSRFFLDTFETIGTVTDGTLTINFNVAADNNIHWLSFKNVKYTKLDEATMDVTEAKYATFVAPFDVTIDGVVAYTVDGVGEKDVLTLTQLTETIPANTPVILFSENTVNNTVYGVAQPEDAPAAGLLFGTYEEIEAPVGTYVLQKQGEKVGFFKVENKQPKVKANHAYLKVADSEVKAFFFGDTATAIQGVMNALQAGETFDLNGRRVSKLQKGGIYIVNGVKVAVK